MFNEAAKKHDHLMMKVKPKIRS